MIAVLEQVNTKTPTFKVFISFVMESLQSLGLSLVPKVLSLHFLSRIVTLFKHRNGNWVWENMSSQKITYVKQIFTKKFGFVMSFSMCSHAFPNVDICCWQI